MPSSIRATVPRLSDRTRVLGQQDIRVVPHHRCSHDCAVQAWDDGTRTQYAPGPSRLAEVLPLRNAALVGHSASGRAVALDLSHHITSWLPKPLCPVSCHRGR
jgi:hypothetical protein